jgi:hypothetical protein
MRQRGKGAAIRKVFTTENALRRIQKMTTSKILNSLVIAALLAGASAHASDDASRVAIEDGKTGTQFKIGDSNCELIDGQIRCTLGK